MLKQMLKKMLKKMLKQKQKQKFIVMIGILIIYVWYLRVTKMERNVNINNYYIRQKLDKNKPFFVI